MKTLDAVLEFGALTVIGILVMSVYEKATAANTQAQVNLSQQSVLSKLELSAGTNLINSVWQ
jgi:hypothetical protein